MVTRGFTKKTLKLLRYRFAWGRALRFRTNHFISVGYRSGWANMRHAYKFFLLNRRFIKSLYCGVLRDKPFRAVHKYAFKKDKKRFYSQNFFFLLERRVCAILYKVGLVSTLGYLKKLVFHGVVYLNGVSQFGYSALMRPLDFVYRRVAVCGTGLNKLYFVERGFKTDNHFSVLVRPAIFTCYKILRAYSKYLSSLFFNKIRRRFFVVQKNNVVSFLVMWWILFDLYVLFAIYLVSTRLVLKGILFLPILCRFFYKTGISLNLQLNWNILMGVFNTIFLSANKFTPIKSALISPARLFYMNSPVGNVRAQYLNLLLLLFVGTLVQVR